MPPVPLLVQRPVINGHEYSHTSIEVLINGIPLIGIKSINYAMKKDVGKVYGTAPQRMGRTRGKEDPSCDMEIYRLEWEIVSATMGVAGQGIGDTNSTIQVTIAEPLMPVIVDQILFAELTEAAAASSDGTDPHVIKLTFDPLRVKLNGKTMSLPLKIGF